ncbi:MAG: ABC transporter ATP-binding protein [Erysipelotrichaceae bacterium]
MLELNKVTKYYGNNLGVSNLSYQINKGEILALLGINGSGKTTSFRIILGLLEASSGSVKYQGRKIGKNEVGYLPEERSLYRDLSVYKQLRYIGRLRKMNEREIDEKIDKYLNLLKITHYKNFKIQQLSKGNQQKVQLIVAILHEPELLILDEPFTGLDVENVELFLDFILRLKAEGKIILISSHQLMYLEKLCDHLIFLRSGKISVQGRITTLKKQSKGHYLSYSSDTYYRLRESAELVLKKENGPHFKYLITNDNLCKKIAKKLLNDPNIYQLKIEQLSLSELIKL